MADPEHRVARVGPALGQPPLPHLLGKIGGGLPGQGRIGGTDPLASCPMAGRAGDDAALRCALVIQSGAGLPMRLRAGMNRHRGIMCRDRLLLAIVQPLRDPPHLSMVAPPVRIGDQLAVEIACVEPSKPWRACTIAPAVKAMAGEAGIGRPGIRAAQRNELAVFGKALVRPHVDRAAGQRKSGQRGKDAGHATATRSAPRWFRRGRVMALAALAACQPPPEPEPEMPIADAANGRAAIERVGCGACHRIPGIAWPQGASGPALDGLATRALIGGALPNRPDLLAAYIRNAPALVPGSAMPAMPVSADEARDIAAYLYEQGGV